MTIFFDKFGGNHGGFNEKEKIILRTTMEDMTQTSERAQKASKCGFKDQRDYMKLFFGSNNKKTIKALTSGINKIHNVLSDPKRLITFVDARNQATQYEQVTWTEAPGFAGEHGAVIVESVNRQPLMLSPYLYAWQYKLRGVEPLISTIKWPMSLIKKPKQPYVHIGVGLRILVGHPMFQPGVTDKLRRITIYHELTHRILQTIDTDKQGKIIDDERCIELAYEDPKQTLLMADCWAYFVMIPFDENASVGSADDTNSTGCSFF